jgi:hypothetical protein
MPVAPLSAPLSLGELIDRITILEIKAGKLTSPLKRAGVRRDLARLNTLAAPYDSAPLRGLKRQLLTINRTLWVCEDLGRRKRNGAPLNAKRLLTQIHTLNDRRHRVKSKISKLHAGGGFEYKSYV